MASKIQITRGDLGAIGKENILDGELFWQSYNVSNNAELGYRKTTLRPYDEGTLYIGRPSNSLDSEVHEDPIPIAGARTYKALVFRGFLTTQQSINDETFAFVREGDFFLWRNTALKGTTFKDTDNFLDGDMLLVISAEVDEVTGQSYNITYTKINTGGGEARLIGVDNTNNDFESTNVQSALEELEYEKVEFGGTLYDQAQVNTLQPKIGTLWLVMTDDLYFNKITDQIRKGDFMIWINNQKGWTHIPSGFTDAELIDYDPLSATNAQELLATFEAKHIEETKSLTDVKAVLDFLLSKKAQLDESGKVPLSQLHDTVLGNLQYMGKWNPITQLEGVTDPNYQNNWPTGVDKDNSNEIASSNNNHSGDYYIVQTDGVNIQYYDKDSAYQRDDGTTAYAREVIELNSGDWVVFQMDAGNKGHWEKIDNSDRISLINFNITGTYTSGEANYRNDPYVQAQVGTPSIAASDKLVILDNNGVMTVAGVRLVDQAKDGNDTNQDTYMPVYEGNSNTLKVSTIQNLYQNGAYITKTNSNLYVGDDSTPNNEYLYGDLYIRPHLGLIDSVTTRVSSKIYFDVASGTDLDLATTRAALQAAEDQIAGAEFTLPNESSTIIGELKGVTLITNRLTKSTHNGYIDSTSIEEHMKTSLSTVYSDNGEQMYSDYDVINIEFHAPTASINTVRTRHITLGKYLNEDAPNGGEWGENGNFLSGELLVEIFPNPDSSTNNVQYMPKDSGILINTTSLNPTLNHGETNRIPMFGEQADIQGLPYTKIVESKARQVENLLFDLLMNSGSSKNASDLSYIEKTCTNEDKKENYNIETDTVIGQVEEGLDGTQQIVNPRSLLVTKSLILGNNDTNVVHFVPGRELYKDDSQYFNAWTNEPLPIEDVYLELPSKSGVLLTSNSRIDGGLWVSSVESTIEQRH